MQPTRVLALSILAVALALACNEDSLPSGADGAAGNGADAGADGSADQGGSDARAVPITPACAALARARCAKVEACTGAFGLARSYGDLATCERVVGQTCSVAAGAPGTGTTPSSVEACAAALAAQSCTDVLAGRDLEACATVPGMRAEGASCTSDAQCATATCRFEPGVLCGACVTAKKAGEPCADARCEPGLVCVSPGAMQPAVCTAPGAVDAVCDAGRPCDSGLDCVGIPPMMPGTGTCRPLVASAGAACDPMRQTTAACDGRLGLFCNPMSRTCENAGLADAGAACGPVDGKLVACRGGGNCYRPGMGPGTCVAPVGEGEACNSDTGPGCIPPAFCQRAAGSPTGLCKFRDPAGCS